MRKGELIRFESKRRMVFRDSLKLLPGSLSSLGQSLCPELGSKGEVDHTSVVMDNFASRKRELVEYMKQDIYLLGGIMLQAPNIYWSLYELYITTKNTLSSLVLMIFRKDYYDEMSTPIAILIGLLMSFFVGETMEVMRMCISRENFFYYDVRSLYPFIMKSSPMPIGAAKWDGNLQGVER